jgi:hypothetical protein
MLAVNDIKPEAAENIADSTLVYADRIVQEAFFLGLLDMNDVDYLEQHKEWEADDGEEVREVYRVDLAKSFGGSDKGLTFEMKQYILQHFPYFQAAMNPAAMEFVLEKHGQWYEEATKQAIAEHPDQDPEDIKRSIKKASKGWEDAVKNGCRGFLLEFKQKFKAEIERTNEHDFWEMAMYWIFASAAILKTRHMQNEKLRIAIINLMAGYEFLQLVDSFTSESKFQDVRDRAEKLGTKEEEGKKSRRRQSW